MPTKKQISADWIKSATEKDLRDATRLTEALAPSEPKWATETTKLLYKELRRRQAAKKQRGEQMEIFPYAT